MSQASIDSFETQIRISNIMKATESLTKIVSDLKDITILNDFKSLNMQITNQCAFLKQKEMDIDRNLMYTKDILVKLLNDLQVEYYSSNYK
jgi:mediator of RNA polymerase II transcription subunit 22